MMFDESLFFIMVTCSLPVIAIVLDTAEHIKKACRRRRERMEKARCIKHRITRVRAEM